ncbi:hypothetical protein GQ600_6900 [Phytophthora cactorum]|nr:hypothetical protein GQ600_6900 [Phytophthora cactorum]
MRAGHTRQSADMPPHIKQAKLLKQASNDKASVVEMDDKPDEDREDEVQKVEPDFALKSAQTKVTDAEGKGGGVKALGGGSPCGGGPVPPRRHAGQRGTTSCRKG